MIEAIEGKGVSRARIICDVCGTSDVVTCDYSRLSNNDWRPNEGQIIRKLGARKWSLVKGLLRCPICDAKRKAIQPKGDKVKATEQPLREPTAKQKREIIGLLELAYDDAGKRFKAGESDKSVAEAIGDGVLWGWVAQIRGELFGPDPRNQEIEALRKKVADIEARAAAVKAAASDALRELEKDIAAIKAEVAKVAA